MSMWVSDALDPSRRAIYAQVETAASWTPWRPFPEAISDAPRLPGVYLLREPGTGMIRYVGMAGERGGGRVRKVFGGG